MNKLNKTQWLLIAFFLIAVATIKVALVFWYENKQPTTQAIANANCSARNCTLPNGAILQTEGRLSDKTPFRITINKAPQTTEPIFVSFSMKDMDMGFNRYTLQAKGDGRWQADGVVLPVCVVARTDYLMDINIDGAVYQIPFESE